MSSVALNYCHSIADLNALVEKYRIIVVNCYSDWCPACSQMKPVFERLAEEFKSSCIFVKVRTDEDIELDIALRIANIPTFLLIFDKTLVGTIEGAIGEKRLRDAIVHLINLPNVTN